MVLLCDRAADGTAVVTLNRPEARNALSAELRDALRGELATLAASPSVRAVVLQGSGGHFCAGGDIRTMDQTDPAEVAARMAAVAETAEALAAFPKPLVAAVSGHAAGAGVALACLCDLVVAETSARFAFSFLKVGLGPDWGLSFTLPRRVGFAAARRLLLTRSSLDGEAALRLGLADEVVAEGAGADRALALARELSAGPSRAMAGVKALFADLDGLRAALAAETAQQCARFGSAEHREGVAAFRGKRAPDFSRC